MLFFYNPGLIDLEAVRTMGASVKLPNSFGMFGTGIKYAVASILRGGGKIELYRGADKHTFSTEERTIRDKPFDLVLLDGVPMGFTTQLGLNWQPWMVLRELGCNARDEGGDFAASFEGRTLADFQSVDQTVVVVEWAELHDAYRSKADLFIEGEPIFENEKLRILPGSSQYLFYRGVRAFKLEKPSALRYDIIAEQTLTEDRTLVGEWVAQGIIREALLAMQDKTALESVLCAGNGLYEGKIDFDPYSWGAEASKAFLDVTLEARERNDGKLNDSARKLLLKHMRTHHEDVAVSSYRRVVNDAFGFAVDSLEELGIEFDEGVSFVTTSELPDGVRSMVEGNRIYIHPELIRQGARDIAIELIKRWVDMSSAITSEDVAELLGPLLVNTNKRLKVAEIIAEEVAATPDNDELLLTETVE